MIIRIYIFTTYKDEVTKKNQLSGEEGSVVQTNLDYYIQNLVIIQN